LAGAKHQLDTTNKENNSEMKKHAEQMKLHRLAKVHDCLKMWQGSQNLRATQRESHAEVIQITAV
jgi:hypothetical protein